ncbi:prolipoprotein diacylglyceryl transferase [Crocinitomicaceae bacterium CZZ-1]|uniref:Phosphatidylglycerol--prolipoprotein diacylglyceryl transferase n=1 Tax=Taishania pollutisoli TaxID=2766479 RepID=A0A8J6U2L7_9FLAO|nr:prolipoprotein diacylglyceryl transferase [Taishania pollutisoli]MBC9813270.1 prolipoprotein diacylglyceryl transferase [Taishania pollutisoli]MBX2948959.1 prolipoprotein diacylglyceryl transferase [Crocinitomicaceae bacterium]NGF76996.1 prolipoprotein diacylglyceryl transferase [Fluviicola sp. SGL-29]
MLAIRWDVTPEIIDGWNTPNYYGLLFVTGLILGYYTIRKMFRKEGIPDEKLDRLVLYVVIATIVGARLGHVFFYDWSSYKQNPIDILKVWEGGLASHGGAIALVIALILYNQRVLKKPYIWIFDRIAAPIAIAGTFIRLGNLMNSEIVGSPTDLPWAFEFVHYINETTKQYDPTPRHPAQLYEAIMYLIIFGILMYMFWKKSAWKQPGLIFGTFLILLFGGRFLVEFVKMGQTAYDETLTINTGQWLSVPFVLAGIGILIWSYKNKNKTLTEPEVK